MEWFDANTGERVRGMATGIAVRTTDNDIRVHVLADGQTFLFEFTPSAAASLAGRIAEALAKQGTLLPTDKSPSD